MRNAIHQEDILSVCLFTIDNKATFISNKATLLNNMKYHRNSVACGIVSLISFTKHFITILKFFIYFHLA